MSRKLALMSASSCVADWLVQAEDEFVFHVPHAVVDAEESLNLFDGVRDRVGEFVERRIFRRDHAVGQEAVLEELDEGLPELAAGGVDEHDGDHVALAGLQEREHFEPFVEGAEAAGEQGDRVALFDEHQLAREEVLHVHELRIAGDDRVGRLLEGEHDVQAHRVFAAGADVAGFHDAAGGAGDDEPAAIGHGAAEFDGLLIGGLVGRVRAEPKTVTLRRERYGEKTLKA